MGWSRFFRRAKWDAERAWELEDYLTREIDDNVARGMTLEQARRAAHRRLGNATQIREEIYQMNTLRFLDSAWQDVRFGARLLLKNRTFAVVAILTLALGTGANAAIFQLVNSLRLRALPVAHPQEIVTVGIETNGNGRTGRFMSRRPFFSEPLWQALRKEQKAFTHLFAWGISTWNVATDGEYRPVQGLFVSGNYFTALGINPHVGRLFNDADDTAGCGAPGAVLTHDFWQSRYGSNPRAVGQSISLDGRPFEIVGVAPPKFFGTEVGRTFDVAVPLCAEPMFRGPGSGIGKADVWYLDIMGRLAPGWTVDRANAHLNTISAGIFESNVPTRYTAETAANYKKFKFTAKDAATGVSGVRNAYKTQLWILLGATGLVLLITCANLANLMLARATARQREIAVRLAIGASRGRIVRQMLSESLVLALLGAAVGLFVSQWLSSSLVAFLSTDTSRLFLDLTPDWRIFAFIAGLACLACLLFGLSPALQTTGANPGTAMQAGGRSQTDSRERYTVRRGLVVVQVALSLVLVVSALLFGRSLQKIVNVDPGFRSEGVLSVSVDVRRAGVDPSARAAVYAQIMDRIRAVPGVSSAAEAFITPMSGSGWNQPLVVDGKRVEQLAYFNRVGPDYLKTMQTRLIAGRTFGPDDRLGATESAIVSELFARKVLKTDNPLGRTFQFEPSPGEPAATFHVVGLMRDSKYYDLKENTEPLAFLAASQDREQGPSLDLVLRSDMPLASLTPALTRTIREVVPGSTVAYESLDTYIKNSVVTERLMATLSGFFGALAMLIATIGLYGVMSYMVMRRKVEIGIRMALGADPRKVVRMVLGESAVLLVIGVVIGTAIAMYVSKWVTSLLYELQPRDPASLVAAASALAVVSLVAAWLPARRASRLAPTLALRED
jgi:putative ABC transport system permease protein